MGIKNENISPHFRRLLLKMRPELRRESFEVQHGIAYLLMASNQKKRAHKTEAGHMTISYQEIYQRFGRDGGIELLTTRYRIFESPLEFSIKAGTTRAFKVAADLAEGMRDYFDKWMYRPKRPLMIGKNGKAIRTLPASIDSLDMNGRDAKAQGKDKVVNFVPVSVPTMKQYRKALKRLKEPQLDLFAGSDHQEIDAHIDSVGRLMDTTQSHGGQIGVMHRYTEIQAGRLYAEGVNLQNIRSSIKEVVLCQQWEYDIENCHYTILHQLAGQYGIDLPAVGHYLAHKKEVRDQIQADIGISKDQAKTCLISLIYGSTESLRDPTKHKDAIPSEIGVEAARRLYKRPLWIALRGDVSRGRLALIKRWPRSRQSIKNAMGKWIKVDDKDKNKREILAHLLQGVESKMLEVVRMIYPQGTISLMQHDGFTSNIQLNAGLIEEAITEATGFVVKIEETRLSIPAHLGINSL